MHLGSMGESVQAVIRSYGKDLKPGDVYLINSPFNGGTHLPDITVITPLFKKENDVLFYVASRGHHADIGSMTPGSMPPMSRTIHEEGVLSTGLKLMDLGHFCEQELLDWLRSGTYPALHDSCLIISMHLRLYVRQRYCMCSGPWYRTIFH